MKPFFIVFFLLVSAIAFSQASPQSGNQQRKAALLKADDVKASVTQKQSPSFQVSNWKIEALQNPSDASAWLNYYIWTSRDKNLPATEKANELSQIFSQAENNVSRSYEYFLMKYLQSGKKDSASLNKAFDLASDKATLYQYKIQHAIITNNKSLQQRYAIELNNLMPMPADLYEYHYNVLMSADSNTVIYAQGLNDLVALASIQYVKNDRKDIQLKYYDGSPVLEPNAYLCLSLGAEVSKKYPKAGYSGLLLKVTGASLDDLKRSISRFDLRIMQSDNAIPTNEAPPIYKNYIPSFLLYYQYLKSTNDASKENWKLLIKRLAERTGDIATVEKQLKD